MAVLATGRLPVRFTPLVGREGDLGAVTLALDRGRLLTLTGPGGTGKTRLALAAAALVAGPGGGGAAGGSAGGADGQGPAPGYGQGGPEVAWVELAPLSDPQAVARTVAARLGVPETPGTDTVSAIAAHLGARREQGSPAVLVVLDNCEHLAAEVARVAESLLAGCPALRILATSREPLGVEGERCWPVPPLDQVNAARLFADRARLVAPGFAVTDDNRDLVEQVCARLDGLPLAIELAAARMRVLSARQLAERLDDVFGLLTGGARSAPTRHQALRATLDWSHDLLTAPERAVFRRLAVFAGGFSVAAAEQVAAFAGIQAGQVLDLVARLADKSLVQVADERCHLLATIRDYAAEQLARSADGGPARDAHLAYFADFAERTGARLDDAAAAELEAELDRLDQEKANLRAAVSHAAAGGDAVAALRLVGRLGRYAYLRGHYREVREWMDQAVAAGAAAPPAYRARALFGSGRLAYLECDYEPAVRRLDAALLLYRELGDPAGIAACLQALGSVAREQGRYVRSARLHAEGLGLAREAGDERAVAAAHGYLGFVSWLQADLEQAEAECAQALALFRALGDVEGTAWSLISLGVTARYRGEPGEADALVREAVGLCRSIGFREGIAWGEEQLGLLALDRGAVDEARIRLQASYQTHRELRDRWRMASVLDDLAAVTLAPVLAPSRGQAQAAGADDTPDAALAAAAGRAAALLGRADALREEIGTVLAPAERPQHERSAGAARSALGPATYAAAWRRGSTASLEETDGEVAALPPPPAPLPGAALPRAPLPRAPLPPAPPAVPAQPLPRAARPGRLARTDGGAAGPLRVRALGRATVELGGTELTTADWGYAKPRELLFLLITAPPLSREQVGAALWPELGRQQLGNALHTALRELRRALGDPDWVVYGSGRYRINRERAFDCDVDQFESALAAAGRARPASAGLPDLRRAVAAYGGDFLAGMATGDWAIVRREELRRRFETALQAVGRMHLAAGRYQAAATAFRRVVEHEPLNESAHRELMTCWSELGETARAVRHYTELEALLKQQVGVAPAAETTALAQRLAGQA